MTAPFEIACQNLRLSAVGVGRCWITLNGVEGGRLFEIFAAILGEEIPLRQAFSGFFSLIQGGGWYCVDTPEIGKIGVYTGGFGSAVGMIVVSDKLLVCGGGEYENFLLVVDSHLCRRLPWSR